MFTTYLNKRFYSIFLFKQTFLQIHLKVLFPFILLSNMLYICDRMILCFLKMYSQIITVYMQYLQYLIVFVYNLFSTPILFITTYDVNTKQRINQLYRWYDILDVMNNYTRTIDVKETSYIYEVQYFDTNHAKTLLIPSVETNNGLNVFDYAKVLIHEIQNANTKHNILHVTLNKTNITKQFILLAATFSYFNTFTVNTLATYFQLKFKTKLSSELNTLEIMDSDTLEEQTFKDNEMIKL